ncbi:MAG: hypothetical protein J1F67_00445 [Muribaculaceae bacterium]|nr:hypothetical protein [Muribaculaceae bacterium]
MKLSKYSGILLLIGFIAAMTACEDETTTIGSSITTGEVTINVDTFYFNLQGKAVPISSFDSKTGNLMIGSINTSEYGSLNCSFVTRLMCVPKLDVADSLLSIDRVDSCKLILGAERSDIVGDSLAPQKLSVYTLTKQLPSDINNLFNPEGYYDPANPLASKSYTLSEISRTDSAFYNNSFVDLSVDLPVSFGKEIFKKYITDPEIFQWPQTMAENFLPGLYVKSTFGKGCVANIVSAYIAVFYYNLEKTTTIQDSDTIVSQTHVGNVTFPFTVSPEVLSSNNINYKPSQPVIDKNALEDGQVVITTPGGYISSYIFPAAPLIERYKEKNSHLSTVNELFLYIPAEAFDSSSGISVAENLLMVKSSEYENFFANNKTPDNKTSFTGVYDPINERYYFTTMRSYFLDLLDKDEITQEDLEFTIIPVEIETETQSSYYSNPTTYVKKCVPYTSKPTMTLLKTDEAMVTFSFSTQVIE